MFFDQFQKLCSSRGESPNFVCQKLGFSTATATHWKKGVSPKADTIKKLADYFDVPVGFFFGDDDVPANPAEENNGSAKYNNNHIIKKLNQIAEILGTPDDQSSTSAKAKQRRPGVRIPVYGETAAGIPITAIEDYDSDDPDDWEEIPESLAKTGEFIALRIKGDSMEPRMKTGDVVIVRLQQNIDNGEIAIVRINGDEATCKKIKKTPEGLWLISLNPIYEPMFYSPREVNELPVTIIGKVVELRAKF